jgi:hypothetical protein
VLVVLELPSLGGPGEIGGGANVSDIWEKAKYIGGIPVASVANGLLLDRPPLILLSI